MRIVHKQVLERGSLPLQLPQLSLCSSFMMVISGLWRVLATVVYIFLVISLHMISL